MTTVQRVAQVIGWAFIVIGIVGFFYTGGSMEADPEAAPKILGLFPVNVLHNIVHLAFGIWGVTAARSFDAARSYGRIAGVIYLALAALAFVTPSMFGLVPIGGHDIWLHILLGVILAAAGFTATAPGEERAAATAPGSTGTTTPPATGGTTTGGTTTGGSTTGGTTTGGAAGGATGGAAGGATGAGGTSSPGGGGGTPPSEPGGRPPAGPSAPPPTTGGAEPPDRPASPPEERSDRTP